MSNTTDLEMCSLTTNVCKPPKKFDTLETVQPFKFLWFEKFPCTCCFRLCACVLFSNKNVGKFLQKPISSNASSSKNIQKTSKCSNRKHTKKENYHFIDF